MDRKQDEIAATKRLVFERCCKFSELFNRKALCPQLWIDPKPGEYRFRLITLQCVAQRFSPLRKSIRTTRSNKPDCTTGPRGALLGEN